MCDTTLRYFADHKCIISSKDLWCMTSTHFSLNVGEEDLSTGCQAAPIAASHKPLNAVADDSVLIEYRVSMQQWLRKANADVRHQNVQHLHFH